MNVLLSALSRPLTDHFRPPRHAEPSCCIWPLWQGAHLGSSLPSCLPPGGPSSQMPKHISLQGPLKATWLRSTGPQPIKHVQCPMLASPSMSHVITGRPVPVCWKESGMLPRAATQQHPQDSSAYCPLQSETHKPRQQQPDHRDPVPKKHKTC